MIAKILTPYTFLFISIFAVAQLKAQESLLDAKFDSYITFNQDFDLIYDALQDFDGNGVYDINLAGFDLDLYAYDLVTSNYKAILHDENGRTEVPVNTNIVFRGYVSGIPQSYVALTISEDFIFGSINDGQTTYFIEPSRRLNLVEEDRSFVLYDVSGIKENGHECGVEMVEGKIENIEQSQTQRSSMGCVDLELSVASDYLYYTQNGSNPQGVIAMTLGVMNQVDTDFDDPFMDEIRFKITENFISSCDTCDPWSASLNISTVLNSFRTWAQAGNFSNVHDLGQLWSGRDFSGTPIGIAYIGAVCTNSRYHLLQNIADSGWQLRVLTSHEIGHNFNCNHDSGTGFIMSASINNTTTWSGTSITATNNHAAGASCLGSCSLHITTQNTPETWTANGSNMATVSWDINGSSGASGCANVDILFSFDGGGSFPYTLVANTSNDGTETFVIPSIPSTAEGRVKVVCTGNTINDINNANINLDSPCAPPLNFFVNSGSVNFTAGQPINLSVTEYYSEDEYLATTFGSFGNVGHRANVNSSNCAVRSNTNYEIFNFTVSATGDYTFNQDPAFVAFSLYDGVHNSATACTNFLNATFYISGGGTGINSAPITETLTAGNTYELVVTNIFGTSETVSFSGAGEIGISSSPSGYSYTYIAVDQSTEIIDMQNATGVFTGLAAGQYDIYGISYEDDGVSPDVDPSTFIGQTISSLISSGTCMLLSANSITIDVTGGGSSSTWYLDSDGDGFGDSNNSMTATSQPSGYVANNTDCDDSDSTVFPGAIELCDGQVNNCGTSLSVTEIDNDNDQYIECALDAGGWDGPGMVIAGGDCDDTNPNIFPGNTEICDGLDNDCDGQVDEGVSTTYYADTDGDGFGDINNSMVACTAPTGYVNNNADCDDNDANNYPGNTEVCDGQDNDCDGLIDEGVGTTYYADNDGDGFGDINNSMVACSLPSGYVLDNTDCDDTDGNNYPGNTEICDGQDNDCDGLIDENGNTTYYADSDGDGFGDASSSMTTCTQPSGYVLDNTDCDDNDGNNYPGNMEICDGQDNDCDGIIDEGAGTLYYVDSDGDGYGDSNNSMVACSQPSGYVTNSADCDDNDSNNFPGNAETCDGQDNNCDGIVDEGCGTCDDSYLVINTITQSTYLAEINIESDATVNSAIPILFSAGTSIDLLPGFEVILGSDFEAIIAPCNPFASAPVSDFGTGLPPLPNLEIISDESTIEVLIFGDGSHVHVQSLVKKTNLKELIDGFSESAESGAYELYMKVGEKEIKQKLLIIK